LVLTKIDEYYVTYSSNKYPPRIWLKSAGKIIGQLIFKPDGLDLPADSNANMVNLYYHLADFQNAIDLLRNEKPLYLLWVDSNSENGLRTVAEPVGESEGTCESEIIDPDYQ
jgi:hypothetical protein